MKIKNIELIKLINAVKTEISLVDVFKKLDVVDMPSTRKFIKTIIEQNNLDISHFNRNGSKRIRQERQIVCPQCNNLFLAIETKCNGFQTTCSCRCSNIYFSHKRMNDTTKTKISNALFKRSKIIGRKHSKCNICPICNLEYDTKYKLRKVCSLKCLTVWKKQTSNTPEAKLKFRKSARKRVESGKQSGWPTRNFLSYAEKYFKEKFDNLNIEYKLNYPVSRRSLGENKNTSYFLDFFFEKKKIDLEIDGAQHDWPERKAHDEERTRLLEANGYKVYRIRWRGLKSNRLIMEQEFENFLELLK